MFINPMWDNESQRIGKRKCTPIGYGLHVVSDLIGLVALLCLIGVPIYLAYAAIRGRFTSTLLWLLLVPFAIALIGNLLFRLSWRLADKKQFNYDYQNGVATWIESGVQHSYKYGHPNDEWIGRD